MMTAETDMKLAEIIGYSIMFSTFGIILGVGLKKFRNDRGSAGTGFGQLFAKGLLITLISCVLYSLTWTIYTSVVDVNFGEIYTEMTIREMQKEGVSEADITKTIEEMEKFMVYYENPVIKFLLTVIEPLFPGILVSLIFGFLYRQKAVTAE